MKFKPSLTLVKHTQTKSLDADASRSLCTKQLRGELPIETWGGCE